MPEIEFTLDPRSGELTLEVKGVRGPACAEVADLAKVLLGEPRQERATAEIRLAPTVVPRVRGRGGPCGS